MITQESKKVASAYGIEAYMFSRVDLYHDVVNTVVGILKKNEEYYRENERLKEENKRLEERVKLLQSNSSEDGDL